jgi:hypothetical protein
MHRDCVDRDRGVLARKVEIELQRLQPPRYFHARCEAYFRNRFVCILFCRKYVDPRQRLCPPEQVSNAYPSIERIVLLVAIQLMESLLTA